MALGNAERAAVQNYSLMAAPSKCVDGQEASAQALMNGLGHKFSNPSLLDQAFRHPSAVAGANNSNQRLEFLGDRVLGLVIADMLYATFAEEDEGALARRYTALVRREALARVAQTLDLGAQLHLSRGEEDGGGRDNPAILADACEALIAALYLDGGINVAESFIRRHWTPLMAEDVIPPQDAKTQLQEWAQGRHGVLPRYRMLSSEGPAHQPLFSVEVSVEAAAPEIGEGRSKRAAEQQAAQKLLDRLVKSHD